MPERRWPATLLRLFIWSIVAVLVVVLATIGVLFLYVASVPWEGARIALATAFGLAVIFAFLLLKPRWHAVLVFSGMMALIFLWYHLMEPSNDRPWLPDVAQTPFIEFEGETVTIRNVRAFRYRAVEDYDEHWETHTYDLSTLSSQDMYFVFWGSRAIAHTMLSFGFEDGRHLVVSVETRKEASEEYSALRSFFKQFELIYILGDERDLVGLRTNHRLEDAYLFPMAWAPGDRRALLVDILERADGLSLEPEFYRTIAGNCTTTLLEHINRVSEKPVPFSFKLLANGYMPELAYERGQIPGHAPFEEIMAQYAINPKAQGGGDGPGFSQRIRVDLGPAVQRPQSTDQSTDR